MARVFSKQRFGFANETIEELQNCSKNLNTIKSTSFGLNMSKTWSQVKNVANKMEEHKPAKLNKLEQLYAENFGTVVRCVVQ